MSFQLPWCGDFDGGAVECGALRLNTERIHWLRHVIACFLVGPLGCLALVRLGNLGELSTGAAASREDLIITY
jgi:hypothetical protein